jgi:hypothetical protein
VILIDLRPDFRVVAAKRLYRFALDTIVNNATVERVLPSARLVERDPIDQ